MSIDLLDIYSRDVRSQQLLTADEQRTLGYRIQNTGDQEARHRLAGANLRLVVTIANSMRGDVLGLLDKIAIGNLALMRAVDGYKGDTHPEKFASYAGRAIRRAIAEALRVEYKHGGESLNDEKKDVDGEEYATEKDERLADTEIQEPLDELIDEEQREYVQGLLRLLIEKDAIVLRMRFSIGYDHEHAVEEIIHKLGITHSAVMQRQAKGMKKLRALVKETLTEYDEQIRPEAGKKRGRPRKAS